MKLGITDHVGKKGSHLPLWNKMKLEKHWRVRCLKESAHMLGYEEINTIGSK